MKSLNAKLAWESDIKGMSREELEARFIVAKNNEAWNWHNLPIATKNFLIIGA